MEQLIRKMGLAPTSPSPSKPSKTTKLRAPPPSETKSGLKALQQKALQVGVPERDVNMALDKAELEALIADCSEVGPQTTKLEPEVPRELKFSELPSGALPARAAGDGAPRCYVCGAVVPTDPDNEDMYLYQAIAPWLSCICHLA